MKQPRLPRATELAHRFLIEILEPGDRCIDATVGNGHDTAFLVRAVGEGGQVFGFDVQPEAIESTRARLEAEGLADRVILYQGCHSQIADLIEGEVRAAMFNLGYLPGGDKEVITQSETTLAALQAATKSLTPGGRLTVVVYPGHPGGDAEADAVESWAGSLAQENYSVASYRFLNQTNSPPFLIVVERR